MVEENPGVVPPGQGEALVGRILDRLAMGISLLDNPDELDARIREISAEGHFNPELYAVT